MTRENRKSDLLSNKHNEEVFRIMGPRCQALATTVVQLFTTQAPDHNQWFKQNTGVLVFTKDYMRKDYFLRLFCLKTYKKIWEHGIYEKMHYITDIPFLHIFEGETCMIALNFASEVEADDMKRSVDNIIIKISNKDLKLPSLVERRENISSNSAPFPNIQTFTKNPISKKQLKKDKKRDKKSIKIKIDKNSISGPQNFQHVSHVGFDKNLGFSVTGELMSDFLTKAGITPTQLRTDKKISKIVTSFFHEHGGQEAVLSKQDQYVRMSTMGIQSSGKNAPPPPPPQNTSNILNKNRPIPAVPELPPPPIHTNKGPGIPPPPPPPPPMSDGPPVKILHEEIAGSYDSQIGNNNNTNGNNNNSVFGEVSDGRADLLKEIRGGIKLKPAVNREVKSPTLLPLSNKNSDVSPTLISVDMVSILKAKLEERRGVVDSDSDSSSEDYADNDDEWSC